MVRLAQRLLCASTFILAVATCSAATITFSGILAGANESPATSSPGTGSALVTYNSTAHTLFVDVVFSGLEAGTTASHIHCCVAPGGNASVATTLPTFAGFPLGVTSGTYINTLDLTLASSYNPAFVTASGGTTSAAEAALATGLEDGMAYLNIHTTMFPSGEVRALLVPVPEPRIAELGLCGLLMLGLLAWRRRRNAQ